MKLELILISGSDLSHKDREKGERMKEYTQETLWPLAQKHAPLSYATVQPECHCIVLTVRDAEKKQLLIDALAATGSYTLRPHNIPGEVRAFMNDAPRYEVRVDTKQPFI